MTQPTDNLPHTQCLLSALATPSLHDLLPGIGFAEGHVQIKASDWPCCEGQGQVIGADQSLRMCSLNQRLAKVQRLYERYLERWAHPNRMEPPKLREGAGTMVSALYQISHQSRNRGVILPVYNEGSGPSDLWRVAMAAAFRFGLKPHIVTLGKTPVDQLYPTRSDEKAPLVLFVERVDKLWDADVLEEFEACVSYAYKAQVPLFFELVVRSGGRPKMPLTPGTRQTLTDRVQMLKERDPINWLPSDIREKLRAVSDLDFETRVSLKGKPQQPNSEPRLH